MEDKRDDAVALDTAAFTAYGTAGAPPAGTLDSETTTTKSTKSTKTPTTTTTQHKTTATEGTSTKAHEDTPTSSPTAGTTSTSEFQFVQLHNGKDIYRLQEEHFLAADFENICLSHNCQTECQNLTRVFTAYEGDLEYSSDGNPNDIPVTLFGICSNLANATKSANTNGDSGVQSFFPNTLAEMDLDTQLITTNLTTCLSTTCEMTRKPSECVDYCRPEYLLQDSDPSLFKFSPGVFECANRLCSNTCGLPYANEDVFGVGVSHASIYSLVLLILIHAWI